MQDREQSEFNMHILYLARVDKILTNCLMNALEINAHGWYHSLMALYREISTSMTPEELDEGQKRIDVLQPAITFLTNVQKKKGGSFIPPQIYNQLFQLEIFLRASMKRSGLLLKIQDDASKALI